MKTDLHAFFAAFPYPAECASALLADFERLAGSPDAAALFFPHVEAYARGDAIDYEICLADARAAGAAASVHQYTAEFLFFCCLAEPLRQRYLARGMSEALWHDAMMDLLYKFNECRAVYGICGSFVASWFSRFFEMTRFALGRLQFETAPFFAAEEYERHGIRLTRNKDAVVNVHIPSGSRMPHEAVMDSYRQVYRFYGAHQKNGLLPIQCSSWLLYPRLREFLPDTSNILQFQRDFHITETWEDPSFGDSWRMFEVLYTGDPAALPRNTSLRRSFADWIAAGGVPGAANGVLLFDGEKIIV